jgi:hypothetical protein
MSSVETTRENENQGVSNYREKNAQGIQENIQIQIIR